MADQGRQVLVVMTDLQVDTINVHHAGVRGCGEWVWGWGVKGKGMLGCQDTFNTLHWIIITPYHKTILSISVNCERIKFKKKIDITVLCAVIV